MGGWVGRWKDGRAGLRIAEKGVLVFQFMSNKLFSFKFRINNFLHQTGLPKNVTFNYLFYRLQLSKLFAV